jgi:hypothetical protein
MDIALVIVSVCLLASSIMLYFVLDRLIRYFGHEQEEKRSERQTEANNEPIILDEDPAEDDRELEEFKKKTGIIE